MTPNEAPQPRGVDPSDPHYELYQQVRDAILAVPGYFRSQTAIAGVMATDIHTLGAVLGATIEQEVVRTLNEMREVWDPHRKYSLFRFARQAQVFPDVLLRRAPSGRPEEDILLGIELKGWYLLAKEGEPSFRYAVTEAVCAPRDLIAVVPWALSQVISGPPVIFTPYVVEAKYAAAYRNYYWQKLRQAKSNTAIAKPPKAAPYPAKADEVADRPASDSGGNFGRLARTGIMDEYMAQIRQELLGGIEVQHWMAFFSSFREARQEDRVRDAIEALSERIRGGQPPRAAPQDSLLKILEELGRLAAGEGQ